MDEYDKLPLNRYARKRQHKWELKKRHTKGIYNRITTPKFQEMKMRREWDEEEEPFRNRWMDGRNGGYTYWETCYLSGPRKLAKQETNGKIRSMYRNMIKTKDLEDIQALSGADYEKEFDYMWTVF